MCETNDENMFSVESIEGSKTEWSIKMFPQHSCNLFCNNLTQLLFFSVSCKSRLSHTSHVKSKVMDICPRYLSSAQILQDSMSDSGMSGKFGENLKFSGPVSL